jgi:molybdenum cofactor guanylyltransferase
MAENIGRDEITAVILAGGRGQRMNGEDKGLVSLWGQPLISHVLETLGGHVSEIVISANRSLDQYRELGPAVYEDVMGESWGPLAGVATVMRHIDTPYLLTVPCDCPCLPEDLVERLVDSLLSQGGKICVAHDGKRLQNTNALMPASLGKDLEDYLESGGRKVEDWLRQHDLAEADFSDKATSFQNINTAEQLQKMENRNGCW